MLGQLYDRALVGERCWIRHQDGGLEPLPAHRWLGVPRPDGSASDASDAPDEVFDDAVTQMCDGPAIELGCGPGRLVARLIARGVPALGIDRSATAIRLAGRGGAPALLGDVFEPLPWTGAWQTVLLVDGNVGLGGDPRRILGRAVELLACGGRCVAEFDSEAIGIRERWVRLESGGDVGPWFRWASVGVDSAAALAAQVGLTLTDVSLIGSRVIASLAAL
ncbi:SAM-dependent methyltransferase [Mycobacterium sp. 050134]|uniref:SAM-dependent methyltransferase n=1 Tax=Mycobacterium sp. 050134 TaxID=3096111 RepID=UPI002EDB6CD0